MRLILTEKNSQAEALNEVIHGKRNGLNFVSNDTIIVPLQGHVMIPRSPKWYAERYDKFSKEKLSEFPDRLELIPNPKLKEKYNNAITQLKKADEIIIATDFDNEGAAIAMNVIEAAGAVDKISFMLEMGSTHKKELEHSLNNPIDIPFKTMAESARARAWIDFTEGMYLSVALSTYLGNNYALKINYGGVKTPLTYVVVERDLAYEQHKVSYFWTIKLTFEKDGKQFVLDLQHKDENNKWTTHFTSEQEAKEAVEKFTSENVFIKSYKETKKYTKPPKLLELTSLQSEMSKKYSFSSEKSMSVAQKNYDQPLSIQSYPRTDTPYLKSSEYEDVPHILKKLGESGFIDQNIINEILSSDIPKRNTVFNDKEVIAHGAIIPTKEGDFSTNLDSDSKNMFELVSKRYTANFMPDYEYLNISGETNTIKGLKAVFTENIPLSAGWKILFEENINESIKNYVRELPNLKEDDQIFFVSEEISRGETKPKPLFTLSSLLLAMKNVSSLFPDNKEIKEFLGESGIGTPATRSTILTDIMDPDKNGGNPPIFEEKKKIKSSKEARQLISALPTSLVSPIKRAQLTKKLNEVAKGNLSYESLIQEYKNEIEKNINLIIQSYEKNGPLINSKKSESNPLGKCPLCDGKIIEKKKIYACTNAKYKKTDDGSIVNEGCNYMIVKYALSRFGKKNINVSEVKKLLSSGKTIVSLVSKKTGKSYNATMVLNEKYGVSIEFDQF